MADERDSLGLAHAEALGLYRTLGHDGNTAEAIRELISIPPKI